VSVSAPCPTDDRPPAAAPAGLSVEPTPLSAIERSTWDRLLSLTPSVTPFSRWTFHRAWWDAYGATAHEQYLLVRSAEPAAEVRAIVPLMHRHEVEAQDAATATLLRRARPLATPVVPTAKAVFFGASYHADYATVLADPADLPAVAEAVACALAQPSGDGLRETDWDVIDLRRWKADDPALGAFEQALKAEADRHGWPFRSEQEDVCPVITLPEGSWDDYLAMLTKKERHEVRRKIRRADGAGEIRFELVEGPGAEEIERFIELHQAKWGQDGLFPDSEGGGRSRRFVHRLAELERTEADGAQLGLGLLSVDGRVVFAGLGFDDGTTTYLYNAGIDPSAKALSPGVVGVAALIRDRLEAGRRRVDFLRGDEPYKYEWGAVDEPVQRLLTARAAGA
jgi:CelD/BcsL family acetyltransferase involved in cellulose biosynthesis